MKASPASNFILSLVLGLSLGSAPALAAKFANQFVEFELPAQWQCNLEGAEWVCQSTDLARKKDAIIVLAAKLKGDQDSIPAYLSYLTAAKAYASVQGKPVKSEQKYAKTINLNGQEWVDALHMESEIPGFYTRYLATVKQDIGVLVTYSVSKAKFQQYIPDFDVLVNSLRVFRKTGGINSGPQGDIFKQAAIPPGAVSDTTIFPSGVTGGANDAPTPSKPKQELPTIPIAIGAALVVIFMIKRRRG